MSGSSSSATTVALLSANVSASEKPALATSVTTTLAPSATVAVVQVIVPPAPTAGDVQLVPAGTLSDTNVMPVGSVSLMTTPRAVDGPLLEAVSVYVAEPPAATLAEPVLTICTSATGVTVTSASSSLSPSDGSPVSDETDALLAIAPASTASTVIVIVDEPPLAIVPRSQLTSGEEYVQPALAESNVTPMGSVSLTPTSSAASGPALETTIV